MDDDIAIDVDSSSIEFTLDSFLKPWDADDPEVYSCEIRGRIIALDDQGREVPLGEIELYIVKVPDAISDEAELAFIFDAISLDDVWAALFGDEDFHPDLDFEFPKHDILVVNRINIEEKYRGTSLRVRAIQTAAAMFLPQGTVVAHFDLLHDTEWGQLGGRPLPGTDYIFVQWPLAGS